MPARDVRFRPREEILSFEEIRRFAHVAARMGVAKIRLTGGEPLVRKDLPRLIGMLAAIPRIDDLALTTNGILLEEQAASLREAGLDRLNVSLDTLRESTFQRISRRDGLDRVLKGIFAAQQVGFDEIRINALAIRGVTEAEIVPLARFSRRHGFPVRFIEFMPLDAEAAWDSGQVLAGDQIRCKLEEAFCPLLPVPRPDSSQPSVDYRFADGHGQIGFINTVTRPFCEGCNRLRLTADGQIRNCLFSNQLWDARAVLQGPGSDEALADLLRSAVGAKKAQHGADTEQLHRPDTAMYQIGG
jgi:cyclic pyranopterin phosphate synthase